MSRKTLDARRLAASVDLLDAPSATAREAAARHIFNVCVQHVTYVRKTYPPPTTPLSRGNGRANSAPTAPQIFSAIHPHINRIARRLDRAMRHAEHSPHPADISALIVAVDAQGALAALFAVAQNAGVDSNLLDALAFPIRQRSAPALLRTLFSPDMRVANAAKKALRQVAAIASCQTTPWMPTIRAALSLRNGTRINRSILLRNLLSRLAELLHLVVKQAVLAKPTMSRKRSSRSSFTNLVAKSRPSLASERRDERKNEKSILRSILHLRPRSSTRFARRFASARFSRSEARMAAQPDRSSLRRSIRYESSLTRRTVARSDSTEDITSLVSRTPSNVNSYPGSLFSSVTESALSRSPTTPRATSATIKRDTATAMYVFQRLLAKRTNPDLEDRIEVISTLADIASITFSGHYAKSHAIEQADEYTDAMASVFNKHGQKIYSVVLDILFRPVREADANRIGVFSFHETGLNDFGIEAPFTRRKLAEFPQSAICLPNMDCTGLAAVSCNSLLKVFLRYVPQVCAQRMALLTGTVNSAFLHASEALQNGTDGCSWEVTKIVSAVDALSVLVSVIPLSVEAALDLFIREPVTLRLVIETCIRSVSATGRLLSQNAARASAPRLSDEGTLDSLRTWQALVKIVPATSSWTGTPSYSSSILFLAQVARRAALVSLLQGYKRGKPLVRDEENTTGETYPSVSTLNSSISPPNSGSLEGSNGSSPPSYSGNSAGFETEEENILTAELHQCVIAMISTSGTSPGDVFFELYRTVVYLYATDLKKIRARRKSNPVSEPTEESSPKGKEDEPEPNGDSEQDDIQVNNPAMPAPMKNSRTRSDEEAKGVLVENIAVDGQLPSRALRRAVMASELDLGEYFDSTQPPSLQHLSTHQTGLPPGMHTFEEFSHALAIVIGTLSNKTITENFEDPQQAAQLISRDVQRSGSSYLRRVHKRAKSILRRDMLNQDYDWRAVRYEERIKRLEEQVASLKSMVEHSIEESVNFGRRKSLPKILGKPGESSYADKELATREHIHDYMCSPSRCFCVT